MNILLLYLSTIFAGIISVLIFLHYVRSPKIGKSSNLIPPPEADGAWPLIGHLLALSSSDLPHKILASMADNYGPIFTIRLGVRRTVVVSSSELAKECFTTNDSAIASRPKMLASKLLGYNYAMFGFAPHGPYWREIRKLIISELLSNQRIEHLKHFRVSEVDSSIKELYNKSKDGGFKIEMEKWFGDLTLNIMLRMVAGKRFYSSNAEDEKEAARCQKAIREFFHFFGVFVVADALPFLERLDVGGHGKGMKKVAKELDSILNGWLEEHKRKKANGDQGDEGRKDFMDVMLTLLDADSKLCGDFDADTVNKATCLSLVTGGSETNTASLTWALSLLLNNPTALKKAKEELDLQVGRQRVVNESDISKLVYLQAIIKETLRLYPPAPLAAPREFTRDSDVGGFRVPKGSRLMVNLWKIQRDPRHWPAPDDFMPERFLTTHKDVGVRGQYFGLIPFSSGRRACPGTNFALLELHLVLARFLQAFDVSKPSNEPVDMGESFGLSNVKTLPLEVIVVPRLPSSLYE